MRDGGHVLLFYTCGRISLVLRAISGCCTRTYTTSETVICYHGLYSFTSIVNGSQCLAPISRFLSSQILHEGAFINRWTTLRRHH